MTSPWEIYFYLNVIPALAYVALILSIFFFVASIAPIKRDEMETAGRRLILALLFLVLFLLIPNRTEMWEITSPTSLKNLPELSK